jgi:hypothetical protein
MAWRRWALTRAPVSLTTLDLSALERRKFQYARYSARSCRSANGRYPPALSGCLQGEIGHRCSRSVSVIAPVLWRDPHLGQGNPARAGHYGSRILPAGCARTSRQIISKKLRHLMIKMTQSVGSASRFSLRDNPVYLTGP